MTIPADTTQWDPTDPESALWSVEHIASTFDVKPPTVRKWLTQDGRVPFRRAPDGSLRVELRYVRKLANYDPPQRTPPHLLRRRRQ